MSLPVVTMRRAACLGPALALSLAAPIGARQGEAPVTLPAILDLGTLLQDRNGDGVTDFVAAQFVLGDTPSAAEVAAAADVAARLGFETTAMNLPLARTGGKGPIIAVGRAGAERAGLGEADLPLEGLAPGQGIVAVRSGATGPVLLVIGHDDAGTRAAAALLAGRLPHVGDPKTPTLEEIVAATRTLLEARQVAVRDITVPAVRAASSGGTIDRVQLEVTLGAAADLSRARQALAALRTTRRRQTIAAQSAEEDAEGAERDTDPLLHESVPAIAFHLAAPRVPRSVVEVPRGGEPAPGPIGRRPGAGAKEDLDLSTLYAADGLLGDSDTNLIPDRIDAILVPDGAGVDRTIDVAARLGLESTGIVVPVAVPVEDVSTPASGPTMVLIGTRHPIVEKLIEQKKLERPALAAGEGLIQVVRKAFGEKSAMIVTGGDQAGLARALEQLAERLPHIWARGKDRTTLDDVEEEIRRFIAGRSPSGQAAAGLYVLDRIAAQLQKRQLESASISVHVEKADEGLAEFVKKEAAARVRARRVDVSVENLDVQKAATIFQEDVAVPSEVAAFWELFDGRVLPAVRKNRPMSLELRLSEPPEVRSTIAAQIREKVQARGVRPGDINVTVLSAYKQGFSWLNDVIRPRLQGKAIGEIVIRFAETGPPPEWTQQAMYAPTRWLLELFPIDEVLARDLKLDLKQIRFEKQPVGSPTYQVLVTGPDGREILNERFEPKIVVRSFFDRFPDYEKVRVTTGWLSASIEGRPVVDQRIVTDPERFWDYYQSTVLERIYDYVMRIGKGKPEPDDAPYFGELVVDLTLSEPDHQLGIDKEQIASMEALHEEIYFNTLHFFDVLGRHSRGRPLDYPGRVIPIVRPKADGQPGRAKVTLTGFKSIRPAVIVSFRETGGAGGEIRRDLRAVAVERPSALGALVRAGQEGITRLDVRVKVDTEGDERDELVKRTRADRIDETITSAERTLAMLGNLERLRGAGLYRDALAFHQLGELRLTAGWTHDVEPERQRAGTLRPNGQPEPWPDIRGLLPPGYRYAGGPIVQWDTPIPPPEAYEILAKMSTLPHASVYKVGESYLGKDIWAMDLIPPIEASHWSQAKATTLKPTIVYSARQHANEVSSTSHVLKLAELLLTEPAFTSKLEKVNVVIHPITNPDGAQLAYDLHKITPDHMLHAGYLGALGVDVTSGQWESDPIYPETRVRPRIWRTWLPDVFLNPHGYPSHEWVQLFSEYAGWVRSRVTESRDWWGMRGWFTPGFGYLDDPKYPRHKDAAFEIRRRIAENINAAPAMRALNRRAYDRYQRYGFTHDAENFKVDFTDGVLIYTAIKGSRASAQSGDFMTRQPKITVWTGSTEAPDETAYGDWMKMVATAGLQWDKAVLDYLVDGKHTVERKGELFFGGAAISLDRPRPPKPDKAATRKKDTSEGGL